MRGRAYFYGIKTGRPDQYIDNETADVPDDLIDITEGVRALYDLVINSMDWSSGFLTVEDAAPVATLAKLFGFEHWEEVQEYVDNRAHEEEAQAWRARNSRAHGHQHLFHVSVPATGTMVDLGYIRTHGKCQWPGCNTEYGSPEHLAAEEYWQAIHGLIPHDHVFSSVGKCMWPQCNEKEVKN